MTSFENDLDTLGIILNEKQKKQFNAYYEMLIQWNSYMNLTTIIEYEDVCKKHFVDSLALVNYDVKFTKETSLIDVGTGAGFPGIPLKIVFPEITITLLDSLNKRIKFLNHVISELGLTGITAIHGRAEEYAKGAMREKFDLCVSRAVANLSTLSEYCLPFVKRGGLFISYKSEKIAEEITKAQSAIPILGGEIASKSTYYLPNSSICRTLIVTKKINITPVKYPRKAGLPTKVPL